MSAPLLFSQEPKPPEPRKPLLDWADWLIIAAIIFVLLSCTEYDYECQTRVIFCLDPVAPCDTSIIVHDTVDTREECERFK